MKLATYIKLYTSSKPSQLTMVTVGKGTLHDPSVSTTVDASSKMIKEYYKKVF